MLFQKRLEGTKVTVESFLAWKAQFDAERLSKKEIVDASAKRLTGKELFLKNVTLNDSDIQFLNEGKNIVKWQLYNFMLILNILGCALILSYSLILGTENTVDVDESLFDDLDLEGEEFEDDSEEDN